MKKEYINPQINDVYSVEMQETLLAGSPVGADVIDENADPNSDILSREGDFEDDDFDMDEEDI